VRSRAICPAKMCSKQSQAQPGRIIRQGAARSEPSTSPPPSKSPSQETTTITTTCRSTRSGDRYRHRSWKNPAAHRKHLSKSSHWNLPTTSPSVSVFKRRDLLSLSGPMLEHSPSVPLIRSAYPPTIHGPPPSTLEATLSSDYPSGPW